MSLFNNKDQRFLASSPSLSTDVCLFVCLFICIILAAPPTGWLAARRPFGPSNLQATHGISNQRTSRQCLCSDPAQQTIQDHVTQRQLPLRTVTHHAHGVAGWICARPPLNSSSPSEEPRISADACIPPPPASSRGRNPSD